MKTRLFISIVIVWGLIGCTRNQEIDIPDANLSLFARTESPANTKTVVEEGVHVFWEPGDEIAVFMGEKSAKFTTDLTAASGTATFKGTFGDESWPEDLNLWAVYPYSEEATFDGETITTVLPSEQVAREGSFGKDMNLSIAHSTSSSLQFYNVGGGIRFSVTEEGIKKVMFEGLSGEIISGKVKIGFDENGKPVVKEVTGGSQFITLLPPSGKETFEPGTWYYIVAIPGALEGGYKLRFYKDSDYARKVSEKKVEIKRSVFGNVEKADFGIDYEATTTHFPKTEEEIIASVQLTNEIGAKLTQIIQDYDDNLSEQVISDCKGIDAVITVILNESKTTLSLMQKDSVWLNVHLKSEKGPPHIKNKAKTSHDHIRKQLSDRNIANENNPNQNKLALILAPFQSDFNTDIDGIKKDMLFAGFSEDNIRYLPNEDADILKFRKDYLSQYSFIVIRTHGGTSYRARSTGNDGYYVEYQTTLGSSTIYTEETALKYINSGELKWSEIALGTLDGKTWRFEMTPRFIYDTSFDNSCILLGGCETAAILEEGRGNGSLVWQFIDEGAGVVAGNRHSINTTVSNPCIEKTVKFLCHGLSFERTYDYLVQSERMSYQNSKAYLTLHEYDPSKYSESITFDIPLLYTYHQKKESESYYLIKPHPVLSDYEEPFVVGQTMSLAWECPLEDFSDEWKYYRIEDEMLYYDIETVNYTVEYDVYITGVYVRTQKAKSIQLIPDYAHKGEWYVVAKIMEGDNVIASYQSDVGHFTVEESIATPEPIDLGLSVKWASFNLGATKPEEYGQYFAWGETATKDEYTWETYQWYDGDENHLTKYNATDQATLLNMDDDVVQQKLKGMWRVPSVGEWQELMEQCTWNWTTRDGVAGYDVTSNLNGKFIFIPAAGYKIGNSIADSSIFGRYWLGTCYIEYMPDSAASGLIKSDIISWISSPRYMGLPIRPVMPIPVESVSLDKTSLRIPIGSKATLTAIILPENATVKDVIWSSSNPSIATVGSITGEITGIAAGSAVITATTIDGHFSAQCSVQVIVPVTGITLDKNTLTISEGETQALMATVLPDNAYNKEVVWSSSNQAIATVTGDGKVTGVSAGSAVITATTSDGNKKATCRITVIKPIPINEIILSKNTLSMIVGESFTLTATILPSNATETDLSWKVDDSSVATVTDGKVTALKKGVTKVRAVHSYSSGLIVEGVCDVTVKDKSGSHEGTEEEGWQ